MIKHVTQNYDLFYLLKSTGWPKSQFASLNGYNYENIQFWPHVVKSKKCVLEAKVYFDLSIVCI